MKIKKNKIRIISAAIIFVILAIIFSYWQNNDIIITNLNYNSSEIPQSFNDYKIVQISDLHNKSFGKRQSKLIAKLEKIKPDIIVIIGDLIDKNKTDVEVAMDFVVQALEISPVYYVSGNHERFSGKYDMLKSKLIEAGAVVLDNGIASIEANGESIQLIGLMDVSFYVNYTQFARHTVKLV